MRTDLKLSAVVRSVLSSLVLSLLCQPALASERVMVCAKYKRSSGWSDGYKVEATLTNGSELNQKTLTLDYDVISTYVVIFWEQHEVSIIKLDFPYLGPIGQSGTDQEGRKWEVAKTELCI